MMATMYHRPSSWHLFSSLEFKAQMMSPVSSWNSSVNLDNSMWKMMTCEATTSCHGSWPHENLWIQGPRRPRVHCKAQMLEDRSPFTEQYSMKRGRGGGRTLMFTTEKETTQVQQSGKCAELMESNPSSVVGLHTMCSTAAVDGSSGDGNSASAYEGNDIAARLPELWEMLSLLRKQRAQQEGTGRDEIEPRGPGKVFLVGTGPGDPDLLTLKAWKLMQTADLVLYDRLVSTDILEMVHADAPLLYVGKTSGYHSRTQEEIHELLLSFAVSGATVLRLKGGDPLVFGRGGEEMDFLQEKGIQVQVVPGITAASGIAAELGIPLTHRGAANSVRFLTGHSRKGGDDPLYVAEQAADPDSTLVIYMGLATLAGLASKLIANGLPPDTPAAAIERGTTPQQRLVFAPLSELPDKVAVAQLVSPTLIMIGRVVALSYLWPFKSTTVGDVSKEYVAGAEPRSRKLRGSDPLLPSQI